MSERVSEPKRIFAVTLFVDDLQATTRFYREVADLPVHYENENSA
jgi:catechol 2,3-dioxygenase-like lactoylglutathione lyase family enzyme